MIQPEKHQQEFYFSTHRETALVTGMGGGKSWILALRMLSTKIAYPTIDLGYISPTHSITRDVLYPLVDELLIDSNIKYKINKSENTINFPGMGKILCRSADDPAKIVGWTVGDVFVDEVDTLTADKALYVWQKAIARMRAKFPPTPIHPKGKPNQIFTTCTPEGFRFLWKHFDKEVRDAKLKIEKIKTKTKQTSTFTSEENEKQAKKLRELREVASRKLIQASTHDNPHLPDGFILNLEATYPKELVDAYVNGQFVNLNSGSVYKHYNPNVHTTNIKLITLQRTNEAVRSLTVLRLGQDFNYDGSVTLTILKIDDTLHVIKEFISKDTQGIIDNIEKYLPKELKKIIYPDASGYQKSTNSKVTDITMLKRAGHTVRASRKNPYIQDRVNSVNSLFNNNRLFINQKECPELHSALLQQIYNPSTGDPEKSNKPASIDDFTDALGYPVHKMFPVNRNTMREVALGGT